MTWSTFPRLKSPTHDRSLDETLERLSGNRDVDGIVLLGSTGAAAIADHADYDLLLVMAHRPVPVRVLHTTVAGRIADIIFMTTDGLLKLSDQPEPPPAGSWDAALLYWLNSGRAIFDRNGVLAALRQGGAVHEAPHAPRRQYDLVRHCNYNRLQNERMLRAGDPVYHAALEVRLLYSILDAFTAYFQLRDLPWRGEKQAIRYLEQHDASFLALFQHCVRSVDLPAKVSSYRELLQQALAPAGPLWELDDTGVSLKGDGDLDDVATALAYWEALLSAEKDVG